MYVQYADIFMMKKKEGVKFNDLPDDWTCPLCGVGKDMFQKVEE